MAITPCACSAAGPGWTMNTLRDAAFDSYLPAFERMIPPLLAAYDQAPSDSLKTRLAEPIAALRGWDYRWGAGSVPTSLAVYWGGFIGRRVARDARAAGISVMQYVGTSRARPAALLGALARRRRHAQHEFRHMEDAVGRDQSVPAHQCRNRPPLR